MPEEPCGQSRGVAQFGGACKGKVSQIDWTAVSSQKKEKIYHSIVESLAQLLAKAENAPINSYPCVRISQKTCESALWGVLLASEAEGNVR